MMGKSPQDNRLTTFVLSAGLPRFQAKMVAVRLFLPLLDEDLLGIDGATARKFHAALGDFSAAERRMKVGRPFKAG
jgi:hypothetical protein